MKDQPLTLGEHTALWIAAGAALLIAALLWAQGCAPNSPEASRPPGEIAPDSSALVLPSPLPGTGEIPFALPTPADADISDFTAIYAQDLQTSDDVIVGDDLEVGDDAQVTGDLRVDGAATFNSTFDVDGSITSGTGAITVTDNIFVDGAADAIQIRAQGYTTQTSSLLVLEQSDGTDVVTASNAGLVTAVDLTSTDDITAGDDLVVGAGDLIVESTAFTLTAPITITGVLTNVRLLYYQTP